MTETITIDGLPEGYYVKMNTNGTYHTLLDPSDRYVFSISARYKLSTITPKLIGEAESHAFRMYKHHRSKAEQAFCEGYTNEQLKAVSMKDMIANIENLHHIASFVVSPDPDINRQVRDATINAAKLLSHLRGIEVQP